MGLFCRYSKLQDLGIKLSLSVLSIESLLWAGPRIPISAKANLYPNTSIVEKLALSFLIK